MRTNLDTGDIHAFVLVAQYESYREAAEQLNVSRSALSRRIQKLESQLAMRLLDRTTREVKLTLAGKEFLSRTQEILANIEELVLAIKGETSPRSSMVTVACIPSIAPLLLPPALAVFNERHPQSRVRVIDMTTSEVLEAIDMGQADFGITYFGAHTPQHEVVRLADDEVVLAIRSDHPFAKKTKVRWSELGKQKLISTWKGAGVRMLIDFELAKTLTRLPWFYEVQQISTALSFVEAGLGVAAVPKAFVPRAAAPQIQTVRLVDPVVTGGLNLVRPQGRRLRPLVEELWTILQQQVRTRFSARG